MTLQISNSLLAGDKPEEFYAVLLKSFHYRYKLGLYTYIVFTVFIVIRE